LFIDEAYALTVGGAGEHGGYGDEAIATLLRRMEDDRGRFCVILAGYKAEMKCMIRSNPGLESRVQFAIDFPDYSREELGLIATRFAAKRHYKLEEAALECILDVTDRLRASPTFANARTVRNILDQVIMNQNLRVENEEEDDLIILQDVEDYINDENAL